MLTLLLVCCGLRFGRPELPLVSVSPAPAVAASAEPGLPEALGASFASALAARGALDPRDGVRAEITVLDASTVVLAASDAGQVHQARLRLKVQLYGPEPRALVLSAERSYSVSPGASLEASAARTAAFEALSRDLCEDAALWILSAPGEQP